MSSADSASILVARDGALARVTFNRPASLNAMGFEMAARWRDVTRELVADDTVAAILLDAAGPAFCAGGDVIEMAMSGAAAADVTAAAETIHDGIRALVESDIPIVAAVQGAVAGGGLGLMLSADYIVAAEQARFAGKYAGIGLTPDLGVTTLLPAAIGPRRALQLLLQDRTLDAATALEWGLVAEVVPAEQLAGRAREVAEVWLSGAPGVFGQAKRLVRSGACRSFAESLADEARTIGAAFDAPAARSRIAAFAAASRRPRRPA